MIRGWEDYAPIKLRVVVNPTFSLVVLIYMPSIYMLITMTITPQEYMVPQQTHVFSESSEQYVCDYNRQ